MNDINEIIREDKETLIQFYKKYELCFRRGRGQYLLDINNIKYLDLTSGIGVVSFGHCNKRINKKVIKQIKSLIHTSNLFYNEKQIELSKRIKERSFEGKTFFCNSGAEANEAALKIARMYGNKSDNKRNKVLSLKNSFHGRTYGAITLTGQTKYQKGLEPLLPEIEYVDSNDILEIEKKLNESVCAIFLEAVQGEGGVNLLNPDIVKKIREITRQRDQLMIFDEVQTGMCRTGKYFGYQNFDIEPDIITLAKALGNGYPVGAVHVCNKIANEMTAGMHASTFGGNYVACAAGIAVFDEINEKLINSINKKSEYFHYKLNYIKSRYNRIIKDIRCYGLMIGIEFNQEFSVNDIINEFIKKNILVLRAGENVLRLLPPFCIKKKDINYFISSFESILNSIV